MASRDTLLPRVTQVADRGYLVATVIKLHGYKVVQQSLVDRTSQHETKTLLSIDGEIYYICSPLFKIKDEARIWKLKCQECETKALAEEEGYSVSLGNIRIQTRKVDVTGDPDGSQLRQLCHKGIMEDIQFVLKDANSCNLLLNLCDVPYPRPEDLCDKVFSSSLLRLPNINKVLVVHPKLEADTCGAESGFEGTWNRYLATDMTCLLWKREECHFTKFEKKYLKHVVQNGLHDLKVKEQSQKNELDPVKLDKASPTKEDGEGKGEWDKSVKEEEKTEKKDNKVVKDEHKSLKREDKVVKREEKSMKKEAKTGKSEQKPAVVRREQKPLRTEQRIQKRNSKIFRSDQLPAKNEPSLRSLKRDQKLTKNEVKATKSESKPTKNGPKTLKKEEKSPAKEIQSGETAEPEPLKKTIVGIQRSLVDLARSGKCNHPILIEMISHPAFRGFCLTLVLLAFYFLSTEIFVTLLLVATSLWFKYGSKKPEFQRYTRSGDPGVLAFRKIYEREIEKMRYAKDLARMRDVHRELKESVLNAYAVNRVSKGDVMGVEHHEELERELELTFKEFVTENDVETLLHEAHYTSFVLSFTVFVYLTSRAVYLGLGKVWRPVRTVAVILSVILLCFALSIITRFLSLSFLSTRLVGFAEMFSVFFGLWLVTDVTGMFIEIRACIDHVTSVIWREVELEKCILKCPSYLVVKLALDCAVLLSLFPLVYLASGVLSMFSVSSVTMVTVSRYFPPGEILLRLFTRLAFFGEVLRLANVIMFVSLASKFNGLHKKREDPLDALLYKRLGHDVGTVTEYVWKPIVKRINSLD